jgi:hypothetical protein
MGARAAVEMSTPQPHVMRPDASRLPWGGGAVPPTAHLFGSAVRTRSYSNPHPTHPSTQHSTCLSFFFLVLRRSRLVAHVTDSLPMRNWSHEEWAQRLSARARPFFLFFLSPSGLVWCLLSAPFDESFPCHSGASWFDGVVSPLPALP